MKFSQPQLEAIQTINKNIVVSASAGAGKTTVLVERLMQRMFKDHLGLDEIIAVTFTEAAASNMKKKLLKSLYAKLQSTDNPAEKAFCEKQIVLLNNALICTMHSFLTRVIKENYAAISLDIELVDNIIDEVLKVSYLESALNKVIDEELTHNFSTFNVFSLYSSNDTYNFNTIKTNIISVFNAANNNLDPQKWLLKIQSKNHIAKTFSEIDSDYLYYFFQNLQFQFNKCILDLDNMINLIQIDYPKDIENLLVIKKGFEKALSLLKTNYVQAIDQLQETLLLKTKASYKNILEYADIRKTFIKETNNLVANLFSQEKLLNDYNINCQHQHYLLELTSKVITYYQNIKLQHKCMDFNDMEHYAYKILIANNAEVAKKYQKQFKEIMVDEFQDTNNVQDAMVNLISSGNNVFRVGDIKQSIYKFRNAQPTIMQKLIDDPLYYTIYLPNNYRSNYNIVNFNNLLFQQLLSDNNLNVKFKEADLQIAELDYQLQDLETIKLVSLPFKNEDSIYKENNAAIFIANDIIDKHQNHGYNFKDFCILLRSHNEKKAIKFILEKANIPNFIDDHLGFVHSKANLVIINYLKLLINLQNEIALIAVLTSPIYQLSDDQLVELKDDEGYLKSLQNHNHPFIDDYKHIKEIYLKQGLLACINAIINLKHYYHNFTSKQDKYDINFLLKNAQDFNSNSIIAYLDYLDIASINNKDGAICVSNEDDVVQVMTIHQSKGLEFKVVYLYDYNPQSLEKQQSSLIINNDLGIATKHTDQNLQNTCNTLTWMAIMQLNKLEELSELIRIFYVATTRPKSRLYILTNKNLKPFKKTPVSSLLNQQISFVELLYCTNINEAEIFEAIKITQPLNLQILPGKQNIPKEIEYYPNKTLAIKKITPSNHETDDITLDFNTKGLEIGTLMHKAMEVLPLDQTWTQQLINKQIKGLTNNQINKLIKLYQNTFFQKLLSGQVYREYNFTIFLDNNLTTGIVDFISINQNEVTIIDYKTDINVDKEILINRYQNQLLMYQKTFTNIFLNKTIKTYIYSFYLNDFIQI